MLKNQNFKIALYIRVSTEEQAFNPEGSVKSQEQRLREAVAWKNQKSNFGEIAGVYIDVGISAKDMRRPKLQKMLADMVAKKINLILVTDIARLSRNNRDFLSMWDMMHDHRCSFMSLKEDFDTTTAAGEMLLFQIMNFAQFERKQTSERVKANMLARCGRGLYNGGPIALGYRLHPEKKGYLEIEEDQANIVRVAFHAFLREGSLAATASWLNEKGYRPKSHLQGGGHLMRSGQFTVDNLQAMLRNKVYLGIKVYTHKGETKEAKAVWDAIIDEATFNRVGEILDKNRFKLRGIKGNRHPYILSGINFCLKCGQAMSGKSATGRNGKVPYYEHTHATKCDSSLKVKRYQCQPHRVPARIAEPIVWQEFSRFIQSETFVKELMEKVKALHAQNDDLQERKRLTDKIKGHDSQLEALAERMAILPKNVSPVHLFKQMEKIEAAKRNLQDELLRIEDEDYENRLAPLETINAFRSYVKGHVLENPDFNVRRRILQRLIRKVEIGEDRLRLHWNLDKHHYEQALQTISTPLKEGVLFFQKNGSPRLTNGHPTRT